MRRLPPLLFAFLAMLALGCAIVTARNTSFRSSALNRNRPSSSNRYRNKAGLSGRRSSRSRAPRNPGTSGTFCSKSNSVECQQHREALAAVTAQQKGGKSGAYCSKSKSADCVAHRNKSTRPNMAEGEPFASSLGEVPPNGMSSVRSLPEKKRWSKAASGVGALAASTGAVAGAAISHPLGYQVAEASIQRITNKINPGYAGQALDPYSISQGQDSTGAGFGQEQNSAQGYGEDMSAGQGYPEESYAQGEGYDPNLQQGY